MTAALYVDTSALGRSLLDEPERPAIEDALAGFELAVSSALLRVELQRLALRYNRVDQASALLTAIALIPLDVEILSAAEGIGPAAVATLDAIHLATAVQLRNADGLEAMITYDRQLSHGAREHGISVLAPPFTPTSTK